MVEALQVHGGDAVSALTVVSALWAITKSYDDYRELAAAGATKLVVGVMRTHTQHHQLCMTSIMLLGLAAMHSAGRDMLWEDDAPAAIVQAYMAHHPCAKTAAHAVRALQRLSEDRARAEQLLRAGAVDALATALRLHGASQKVASPAVAALLNIAMVETSAVQVQDAFLRAGVPRLLVSLLDTHKDAAAIVKGLLDVCLHLCKSEGIAALAGPRPDSLRSGQIVSRLEAYADVAADASGPDGFTWMKMPPSPCCTALVESGVVPAILDAMGRLVAVGDVLVSAGLTLQGIGTPDANKPLLANGAVVAGITALLRRHKTDRTIVPAMTSQLVRICDVPASWPHLASSGTIPALIGIMRLYGKNASVVGCVCRSLAFAAADAALCDLMLRLNLGKELAPLRARYGKGADLDALVKGDFWAALSGETGRQILRGTLLELRDTLEELGYLLEARSATLARAAAGAGSS